MLSRNLFDLGTVVARERNRIIRKTQEWLQAGDTPDAPWSTSSPDEPSGALDGGPAAAAPQRATTPSAHHAPCCTSICLECSRNTTPV